MKRCKHRNINYVEFIECSTSWWVYDGKPESEGYHHIGDMMEPVSVRCLDCGLSRTYRTRKQQPLWLRKIAEQIGTDPL